MTASANGSVVNAVISAPSTTKLMTIKSKIVCCIKREKHFSQIIRNILVLYFSVSLTGN